MAILLCLLFSGCNTYLGYHVAGEVRGTPQRQLIKTHPPHQLKINITGRPNPSDCSMDVKVSALSNQEWLVETEISELREKKYGKYDPLHAMLLEPLGEFALLTPVGFALSLGTSVYYENASYLCVFPPFDLFAKIVGKQGYHGIKEFWDGTMQKLSAPFCYLRQSSPYYAWVLGLSSQRPP